MTDNELYQSGLEKTLGDGVIRYDKCKIKEVLKSIDKETFSDYILRVRDYFVSITPNADKTGETLR